MLKEKVRFRHVVLFFILAGVVLRLGMLFNANTGYDGTYYVAMGRGFSENGEFVMEWGDFGTSRIYCAHSHHFSPAFPVYLAAFYTVLGFSFLATKIASVTLSLLFLLVAYLTTKNLYGKDKALIVTAFFSVCFPLLHTARIVYSENLVMIFFMLTLWAIMRGIEDDRYMVWAGLFAGLGYLTKASVGYFFLIAGCMGFLWRFYYMRWDVFKRKYYLLAICLFLAIVGLWSLRNIMLFGFPNWETSYFVCNANEYALSHPSQFFKMLLFSLLTFAILFLTAALFFARELRATLSKIKIEHYSGLWLAIFIVFLIGIVISSALALVEEVSVFTPDRIRYIIVAFVPLVWLAVKDTGFQLDRNLGLVNIKDILSWLKETLGNYKLMMVTSLSLLTAIILLFILEYMTIYLVILMAGVLSLAVKSSRKRLLILLTIFLLVSVDVATEVRYSAAEEAAMDLRNHVQENDTVAICMSNKYAIYPYLDDCDFTAVNYDCQHHSDWIVSNWPIADDNYTLIREYEGRDSPGIVFSLKRFLPGNHQFLQSTGERKCYLYKQNLSEPGG
ncbi:MAG: glycosyltransferase family 39 protein [Thermoplasmata archaeon]|nr:MAG: glycosyltransferase family 39 protein [Thermoplasmata archaeon]